MVCSLQFAVMLMIIFILEVAGGVAAYIMRDQVPTSPREGSETNAQKIWLNSYRKNYSVFEPLEC